MVGVQGEGSREGKQKLHSKTVLQTALWKRDIVMSAH